LLKTEAYDGREETEVKRLEQTLLDITSEMYGKGVYRPDSALVVAAYELTMGRKAEPDEIEEEMSVAMGEDKQLFERYLENFYSLQDVQYDLNLMGGLPSQVLNYQINGEKDGVNEKKGLSPRAKKVIGALLLCIIGGAAGYVWYRNSRNNDEIPKGPNEKDIYNGNIAGLKDYEKAALAARYGQANAGMNEDWDLDNQKNKDEAKINPHYIFDPTDSHEDGLKEESVRYVDRLVAYDAEHNPNNLLPDLYGNGNLVKAIDLVEAHPDVPEDFTPRECHIMVKLPKYTPNIMDKPMQVRGVVPKIDDVVYDHKLDTVEGEDYAWSKFVGPAINHIVDLQQGGKIDLSGLTPEEAGHVLFPEELAGINIKIGERMGPWPAVRLECGIDNVTPDESLGGKSPQHWLRDLIKESYEAKDFLYEDSMDAAYGHHPHRNWSNSGNIFREVFEQVKTDDGFAIAIIGYPDSLRMFGPESLGQMSGQAVPTYSVLIGREFGRPVYDIVATYPIGGGSHSEALVKLNNGEYFGFWMDKDAFLKDYEGSEIRPNITQVYVGNGRWVPFKLD